MGLQVCRLCPRECAVDRSKRRGFCGVSGNNIRVGRASLHMWEEPCISGTNGSGTIFFAGCNLKCVFCQNKQLSACKTGTEISTAKLSDVMLSLQEKGAHNINLVTPTQYVNEIIEAVSSARKNGLTVPIVYNTSGYEKRETIARLFDTVSIFLTDFKYFDNMLSRKFSKADDYFEQASTSLEEMVKQTGKPKFDTDDMMLTGTIVRHLILPGHIDDSKKVIQYLYKKYGDEIILSIMNQYTPMGRLPFQELNRKVTQSEYDQVINFALELGIENAFIQEEGTQEESFIPSFNGEGLS